MAVEKQKLTKYRSKDRILEPYVNDYKANIFNIAFLDDETVQMFQSDFRIVADFFVQKRKNKDYVPDEHKIKHVDEMLKLLQC